MRIPNKIHGSPKGHWTLGFTGLKTSILATVFTFFQIMAHIIVIPEFSSTCGVSLPFNVQLVEYNNFEPGEGK